VVVVEQEEEEEQEEEDLDEGLFSLGIPLQGLLDLDATPRSRSCGRDLGQGETSNLYP